MNYFIAVARFDHQNYERIFQFADSKDAMNMLKELYRKSVNGRLNQYTEIQLNTICFDKFQAWRDVNRIKLTHLSEIVYIIPFFSMFDFRQMLSAAEPTFKRVKTHVVKTQYSKRYKAMVYDLYMSRSYRLPRFIVKLEDKVDFTDKMDIPIFWRHRSINGKKIQRPFIKDKPLFLNLDAKQLGIHSIDPMLLSNNISAGLAVSQYIFDTMKVSFNPLLNQTVRIEGIYTEDGHRIKDYEEFFRLCTATGWDKYINENKN